MQHLISVILPLKIGFRPTYRISKKVSIGDRVAVTMAGRRYIAVVSATDVTPDIDPSRVLSATLPDVPLPPVSESELKFWKFLSDYYLCTIGEVYKAAYPEYKTEGETKLLKKEEQKKAAAEREADKRQTIIRNLEKRLSKKDAELAKPHGTSVTERLTAEREKILQEIESRKETWDAEREEPSESDGRMVLRTRSANARNVLGIASDGKPMLIWGGRGRNEIVAECAKDCIARGLNCLVLVPEKKTDDELERLLKRKTGGRTISFSSSKAMGDRRRMATDLRDDPEGARVYIGTRSSLFLPWKNLGLIMVDSEEDPSHKSGTAPRLNARDAAIVLSRIHSCPVILSSACPSLESYQNAVSGKYGCMRIPNGERRPVTHIDTDTERLKNGMAGRLPVKLLHMMRQKAKEGGKCLLLHPWENESILSDLVQYAPGLAADGSVAARNIHSVRYADLNGYSLIAVTESERIGRRTDFRADERRLQLLTKIRSAYEGDMVILTSGEDDILNQPTEKTLDKLLNERCNFLMPPYLRLVNVTVKDSSENRFVYLSGLLMRELTTFETRQMKRADPKDPGMNILEIQVLLPRTNLQPTKRALYRTVNDFETRKKYTGHITVDVDPV